MSLLDDILAMKTSQSEKLTDNEQSIINQLEERNTPQIIGIGDAYYRWHDAIRNGLIPKERLNKQPIKEYIMGSEPMDNLSGLHPFVLYLWLKQWTSCELTTGLKAQYYKEKKNFQYKILKKLIKKYELAQNNTVMMFGLEIKEQLLIEHLINIVKINIIEIYRAKNRKTVKIGTSAQETINIIYIMMDELRQGIIQFRKHKKILTIAKNKQAMKEKRQQEKNSLVIHKIAREGITEEIRKAEENKNKLIKGEIRVIIKPPIRKWKYEDGADW